MSFTRIRADKTLLVALLLIVLGGAFIIAESTFYQFIDADGMLHESLFMSLGMLSIVSGFVVFLIFVAKRLTRKFLMKS